eukprot:m.90711 g.90711  ORF g.90711 m.90711 type:complete len:225 (-) comp8475_c0_seq3:2110-2784(-)
MQDEFTYGQHNLESPVNTQRRPHRRMVPQQATNDLPPRNGLFEDSGRSPYRPGFAAEERGAMEDHMDLDEESSAKRDTLITIFGFLPQHFDIVVQEANKIAPIVQYSPQLARRQNFVHIAFARASDALKAIRTLNHTEKLGLGIMIGVVPCVDPRFPEEDSMMIPNANISYGDVSTPRAPRLVGGPRVLGAVTPAAAALPSAAKPAAPAQQWTWLDTVKMYLPV